MKERLRIVTNGLLKENPSLRLVLGTCPTLAVTTVATNGLGMGLAATFVLIGSNIAISALRKVIPDKVRLPAYITVIAAFVTILQMLVQAYMPALDTALGIYLPLIVVNCIILGRAEMFASKNNVVDSALDGLGMGLGFDTSGDGQRARAAGGRHTVQRARNGYAVRGAASSLYVPAHDAVHHAAGRLLGVWRADGAGGGA